MTTKQFARAADGSRIAYHRTGDGPALVYVNGFACTDSYWRYLRRRFEGRATQIFWDFRGHGDSQPARDLDSVTIAGVVDDMLRVMDAAGVERATLVGFSLGAQIVLEAWRHAPERIDAIVPLLGPYEHTFDTALPLGLGAAAFEVFRRLGPRHASTGLKLSSKLSQTPLMYRMLKLSGMVGKTVRYRDMEPFFAHLADVDGPTLAQLAIAAQQHSAADLLETVDVPVLVVSGGRDSLAPPHLGRKMQRRIPRAELLVVPDATHTGVLGHNEAIEDAIARFLERHGLLGATDDRERAS